jgi:hydroxyacylglutathione hydrolase
MANFEYHQYSYMSDNYGVLLHSKKTGDTIGIDVGDASALLSALEQKGWQLTHLLVTHHHADHVAGLAEVKNKTGCKVTGPANHSNIDGLDSKVADGDIFSISSTEFHVLQTPGHTLDMLNYYLPEEKVVFTGDTLFTLGCGRVFEGDPSMMWNSLQKLMLLPHDTLVYSSHEYTLANAAFAVTVDPNNSVLEQRIKKFKTLRADNQPTVPSLLADELATNPFLRAADPDIRANLQMESATDAEVFAEVRRRKDNF